MNTNVSITNLQLVISVYRLNIVVLRFRPARFGITLNETPAAVNHICLVHLQSGCWSNVENSSSFMPVWHKE